VPDGRRLPTAATIAIVGVLVLTSCAAPSSSPAPAVPGTELAAALAPGATLRYVRDGAPQPVWTVDSVARGVAHGGRTGCARIRRRTAPAAPSESLLLCVAGDTLLAWDARTGAWRASRPLGALTLVMPRSGGAVRMDGGAPVIEQVGRRSYRVVPTVVTTLDSAGRPVRRLRERYAPALATATGGVFEVRDSTGEWRREAGFELAGVEPD
jgi:hypothetical protein